MTPSRISTPREHEDSTLNPYDSANKNRTFEPPVASSTSTLSAGKTHSAKRTVRGAIFGNYVDQIDIFLPVIALAPVTHALFGEEHIARNAGLVFIATLIGRPIGSFLLGLLADRIGRARVATIALLGMASTSFAMAGVPGHETWGSATLYAIVALRFLCGVFLGGQYSAAIPLAMEGSTRAQRGKLSGTVMAMSPTANASVALTVLLMLTVMPLNSYQEWGWRVLFIAAGALAVATARTAWATHVAATDNSPRGATGVEIGVATAAPAPRGIRQQTAVAIARIFILMTGLWLVTNMAIPVLTQHLSAEDRWDARTISLVMLAGTASSAVTMWLCGRASNTVGRRVFFAIAGAVIAVLAPVLFLAATAAENVATLVGCVIAVQVFTVSVYGPIGAYLSESFPREIRSAGYGIAYSCSIVVPALYPYYLPILQERWGQALAPAVLLACAGALIAVGSLLDRRPRDWHTLEAAVSSSAGTEPTSQRI